MAPAVLRVATGGVIGRRVLDLGDERKATRELTNANPADGRVIAGVVAARPRQHAVLKKLKLDGDVFFDKVAEVVSHATVPAEGAFATDVKRRRGDAGGNRISVIECRAG